MTTPERAVFLVQRIGPYHDARLRAWARRRSGTVHAVEYRPHETVYAWTKVPVHGDYQRSTAVTHVDLIRLLHRVAPDVVVCTGYADAEIHAASAWALERGVPLVACSDSTYVDEPRTWIKEHLKRRIVASFGSALVAGTRADTYMAHLGMPANCRFAPWDVVDNVHFARGAAAARREPETVRRQLGVSGPYFLSVARFVPKKNLASLLQAYARYATRTMEAPWSLVLSGSGGEEAALRAQARELGVAAHVSWPGFVQYPELPKVYGLAGALVLPSRSEQWGLVVNEAMAAGLPVLVSQACGCASDLVEEGSNGYTFDPADVEGLAQLLKRMAESSSAQREAMGHRSQLLIGRYSPDAFADGLERAVAVARIRVPRRRWWSQTLLRALSRRRTGPGH